MNAPKTVEAKLFLTLCLKHPKEFFNVQKPTANQK